MLEKLPIDSPDSPDFFEAIPLGDRFPRDGAMRFSSDYPDFIHVFDFVTNTLGLPIVSGRMVDVLIQFGAKHFESLPVTLLDHKGRVASKEHSPLSSEELRRQRVERPGFIARERRSDAR